MGFQIKHNGYWHDADSIWVKQNGVWVEADEVLTKSNGTWQSAYTSAVPSLTIIDYAQRNTLLGGFTYDDCWNPPGTSRVGTTGSFFYDDADGLSVRAPYWGCGTAMSNQNVDLTGVVSATITFSWSGVAYYGGGSVDWPQTGGTRQGYSFRSTGGATNQGLTTVTVPVTNPGVGTINFGAGNTSSGRIYMHQLIFNYV
jgi:hypothetical protein